MNSGTWWRRGLPALALLAGALAQGPAVAEVVDDDLLLQRIEQGCERLRAAGALLSLRALRDGIAAPPPALAAAAPAASALPPATLRARLLRSTWIVGHYAHCDECDGWHFSASTGFAVHADGVLATCAHLLADEPALAPAAQPLLAAADWQGQVFAVTQVLALDADHDVVLLRCTATDLVPVPVRSDVGVGEPVYCLSNPDHMFATFTAGNVSRRYRWRGPAPGTVAVAAGADHAPPPLTEPGRVFLQVACEFAGGSSGAPIVDGSGNLVGIAQSTTTVTAAADAAGAEVQMVARTAVPAAALLELLRGRPR
jgi:S1-C subfamily serine protease